MLKDEHCIPGAQRLADDVIAGLLPETPGWGVSNDNERISRRFEFRNFHETMGFANAVAFLANQEDHHPDLELAYKNCMVHFTTHSAGGLSRNDFILAARINALLR